MSRENVEIVQAVYPPSGTDLSWWFADDAAGRRRLEQQHGGWELGALGGSAKAAGQAGSKVTSATTSFQSQLNSAQGQRCRSNSPRSRPRPAKRRVRSTRR